MPGDAPSVSSAVGFAAVDMVEHIGASCIVTPTVSGKTARLISNLRPSVPIYAVTPYEWVKRKMQLYWGVISVTGYEEGFHGKYYFPRPVHGYQRESCT